MLNDFKKFIARGNVIDMAVGIIIGAAFPTVVKSLVDDILMPPIGRLLGGADFSNLFVDPVGCRFAIPIGAQRCGHCTQSLVTGVPI